MVKFNEVTWYSKLLAAILLFGVLPILSFYIGVKYQQRLDWLEEIRVMEIELAQSGRQLVHESMGPKEPNGNQVEAPAANSPNEIFILGKSQEWVSYAMPRWGMTFEYPGWWNLKVTGSEVNKQKISIEGEGYLIEFHSFYARDFLDGNYTTPAYVIGGVPTKKSWEWEVLNGFEQVFSLSDSICLGRNVVTVTNFETKSKEISDRILSSIKCDTSKSVAEFVHVFSGDRVETVSQDLTSNKLKVKVATRNLDFEDTHTVSGEVIVNIDGTKLVPFKQESGDFTYVFYATYNPTTNEYDVVKYGRYIID